MKIALAGNPNSGKTTLFNALTGKHQYVGNWAGVTVSKGEASLKKSFYKENKITIIDLPGAYSMSPYTTEESVTRDYILKENPDIIINIVDATNLSRNLFLTTELLEIGIPVIVCINKIDRLAERKDTIDELILSNKLNAKVVKISAQNETGLNELIDMTVAEFENGNYKKLNIKGLKEVTSKEVQIENDKMRFSFTNEILKECESKNVFSNEETLGDRVDNIVAHKWFGIPIFGFVMWLVFLISQSVVGPFLANYLAEALNWFYNIVNELLTSVGTNAILQSLILDGIIAGVSAVIGYLPLIMLLFFCLSLLEDCGYMARVAVVMDRHFKKIGLSGKSIIPIVVGAGCAVPGIMATRTIKDEKERRMTAILTPFIPCSAKVVIIALFAGVFFPNNSWISPLLYLLAIGIIILTGLFVKLITGANPQSNFIIELPEYRIPSVKKAMFSMVDKAKSFIIKAATVILVCNTVIWFMQTYTWKLQLSADIGANSSILASIAHPFAFLLIPLGFGLWQFAAASISGFAAKESVVGTLAVVFATTRIADESSLHVVGNTNVLIATGGLTAVAALAFLIFNLFTPPCFAAMSTLNAELNSKKWFWSAVAFQFGVGYFLALIVNQIGTLIFTGHFASGSFAFFAIVIAIIAVICYIIFRNKMASHKKNVHLLNKPI